MIIINLTEGHSPVVYGIYGIYAIFAYGERFSNIATVPFDLQCPSSNSSFLFNSGVDCKKNFSKIRTRSKVIVLPDERQTDGRRTNGIHKVSMLKHYDLKNILPVLERFVANYL